MLYSRRTLFFIVTAFFVTVLTVAFVSSAAHAATFGESFAKGLSSWPWYITRAAGLVSVGLMLLLMLSGIGLVTGHTYRYLEPLRAWMVHRALGISLLATIAVHVFSLLFDKYAGFNILDLLVPMVSQYRTSWIGYVYLGSINMALGILAMYLLIYVVVTSLRWIDSKPHAWKIVHYLSYLATAFVFFHTLFLGTDFKAGWSRTIWVVVGIAFLGAIIMRLRRAGTLKKSSTKL